MNPSLERQGARSPKCHSAVAAVVACLASSVCAAQPQDAISAIAAEKTALRQPDLAPEQRMAAIEHIIKLRGELIAGHPNDPDRAIWLADQAADFFFELLPVDATGLTALFGRPSAAQLDRARRVAREMIDLATGAETAVAQAILNLESLPRVNDDPALQQRRRELTEIERDRRIPFLRGIGAVLQAELNPTDTAQRRKQYELTARLLLPLADSLEGAAAIEARLYAGLAQARLGEFDAAETCFITAAKAPASNPSQLFAARMGGVINRTVRGGAPSGLDALASIEQHYAGPGAIDSAKLFYRVLIADQRFLLRRQLADQSHAGPQRDELLAQALAAYTDLLRLDTTVAHETMQAIVFARLSDAADADAPLDQLPGLVLVARADQLSRSDQTREQAITMLESALQDDRLDSGERAAALFVLGRALYDHGQPLFAARRFIDLAANHPADSQAQRAIELGATIASELHRKSLTDQEAIELLHRALEVLLQRYPNLPTIDRWRYAAARLAMDEGRFDQAVALFAQVTPSAAEWLDANFMQAAAAAAAGTGAAAEAAAPAVRSAALLAVIERVRPVIESGLRSAADPARAAALRYYLGMLRVFGAQAQLNLEQPQQAIEALAGIDDDAPADAAVLAEALKVRIGAYQALKRPDDALREIERFVQASPTQTGSVLGPMLASMQRDVQSLIDTSRDEQAVELAQRTMLPVAQLLERWLASSAAAVAGAVIDQAPLLRRVAETYRLSARFADSLAGYERLLRDEPDAADLLLGQAECLFHLGGEERLAEAMRLFKRLAAAGPQAGRDNYWLAQLRMLQIIDQVNRNTQQIVPRIEQLRQQDAQLGGERFRRGFEALRIKRSRSP